MQIIEEIMKVAVCFTGTGRSIEYTMENIMKTLISPFNKCDVFAHLTKTKHLGKLQKYLNFKEVKKIVVGEDIEMPIADVLRWRHNWPAGLHSGNNPKKTYLNMLRSRKLCGEILREHSAENQIEYDMVIFSRLDVEYYTPLPVGLNLNNLCVPDFHNHYGTYVGCNDRFAVSSYDNMQKYFSLYDKITDYHLDGVIFHAETTLEHHIKTSGVSIEKYHFRFGRIRPDGFKQDKRMKQKQLAFRDL